VKEIISIHIPKGNKGFNISNELNSATNIKDRVTRQATITGLNKIAQYL